MPAAIRACSVSTCVRAVTTGVPSYPLGSLVMAVDSPAAFTLSASRRDAGAPQAGGDVDPRGHVVRRLVEPLPPPAAEHGRASCAVYHRAAVMAAVIARHQGIARAGERPPDPHDAGLGEGAGEAVDPHHRE